MIKNKIKIEVAQGGWGIKEEEPPPTTLREFAEAYIKIRKATKAARTAETDERAFRELEKFVGNVALSEITEERTGQFKAQVASKLQPATVNLLLRHLN